MLYPPIERLSRQLKSASVESTDARFLSTTGMSSTTFQNFHQLFELAPYSRVQRNSFDNAAVLRALRSNPSFARMKNEGCYGEVPPLFMAVSLGATEELVGLLCDFYPESLEITDRHGRTPLHQAVEFGASPNVVRYLLGRRSDSAAEADQIGRTPLHCAAAYGASLEIAKMLCTSCPHAAFQKDRRGRLPLHVICAQEDADLDFVKFLLEANPRAVVERTAESVTALEIVEKGRAPLEIIFPLSAVALMIKEVPTCAKVASLVKRLNAMNWPRGVFIYMDLQTSVTHFSSSGHDIKMMPQILSVVAQKCKADTLFSIVKERLPGIIR